MELSRQLTQLLAHFAVLRPEVGLAVAFLVVVVVDLVQSKNNRPETNRSLYPLTLVILGIVAWLVAGQNGFGFLFGRMLLLDGQAIFFKYLILLSAALMLAHGWALKYRFPGEFFSLLLALLLGLFLLTMAINLLTIFLAIELISICSYILTALNGDRRGAEGAIKYALFGTISAAIMLYGMSLLYGLTATLDITDPAFSRTLAQANSFTVGVALVLTLSGILFKLAAVPFHLWNPDVYQAAPLPVVSFFSVAPKAAAFLALMRIEAVLPVDWSGWLSIVALVTIGLGNFSALWQQDTRRMLAYSSIAQSGFVLLGLAAATDFGLRSATFYIATYLFASMGAFLVLDVLGAASDPDGRVAYRFERFRGLGQRHPAVGVIAVVLMISLVGLPLTAGFSAKLLVFSSLWETYQTTERPILGGLLLFGVFNAAVSLVYYLKLPFLLFFREREHPDREISALTPAQWILLTIITLPIIVLFLRSDWLMNWLERI